MKLNLHNSRMKKISSKQRAENLKKAEPLIQYITKKNISQSELAQKSGLHLGTINRIIHGWQPLRPNTLQKIADGIGVEYYILNGEKADMRKKNLIPLCGYLEYNGNITRVSNVYEVKQWIEAVERGENPTIDKPKAVNAKTKSTKQERATSPVPQDPETPTSDSGMTKGVLGAIIGDIVGSRFEFVEEGKQPKKKNGFALFTQSCSFTDDTALTIAICDWLLHRDKSSASDALFKWGKKYRQAGYGGSFKRLWLKNQVPYGSQGNGSGMRVCGVAYIAETEEECLRLAEESAAPTHNSVEGYRCAKAIAMATFWARKGKDKEFIKQYIIDNFGFEDKGFEAYKEFGIHSHYETAKDTWPIAFASFLEADNYEDTLRTALLCGNDSDTICAMAGSIAAAMWGIPQSIITQAVEFIPAEMLDVINEFDNLNLSNHRYTPTNFRTWKTANTCLVFGASTEGNGETAAFNARRYGAKPKTAGPFTHSYGIHTKEQTLEQVTENVKEFLEYYNEHPEKTYLITTVGTSGAGFEIKQIAPLFKELADKKNVYLPEPYRKYLEEHE